LRPGADADQPGAHVDDAAGNEERRNPPRSAIEELFVVLLDHREPADPDPITTPTRWALAVADLQPRLFQGHLAGRDGVVDEGVELLDLFGFEPQQSDRTP
jgi:hypothetical protein